MTSLRRGFLLLLVAPVASFRLQPSSLPARVPSSSPSCLFSTATAAGALEVGEVLPEIYPTLTVTRVAVEDAVAGICQYRVKASIHGPDVKDLYKEALKGAQKRANYPGFRKGVVPPQYLIAVKHNALNAAVLDSCRHAIEAHGMQNFEIKARPLRMVAPASVDALCNSYDIGAGDLQFEAEIWAMGAPGSQPKAPAASGPPPN